MILMQIDLWSDIVHSFLHFYEEQINNMSCSKLQGPDGTHLGVSKGLKYEKDALQ